ncbi:hypothetical protein O9929_14225 [Vibrio lentus]|nr:hypothetical protein [Vibrio lentus]
MKNLATLMVFMQTALSDIQEKARRRMQMVEGSIFEHQNNLKEILLFESVSTGFVRFKSVFATTSVITSSNAPTRTTNFVMQPVFPSRYCPTKCRKYHSISKKSHTLLSRLK